MNTMGSKIELTMDVTCFLTFSRSKMADGKGMNGMMNVYSKQIQFSFSHLFGEAAHLRSEFWFCCEYIF